MDDELAEFTKGGPPGRRRPKLERYAKLVLDSHDLGWTCGEIAVNLQRKKHLTVSRVTVWRLIHQHRAKVVANPTTAGTTTKPEPSAPQPTQPSPPTFSEPPTLSNPNQRKARFNLDT
jgi:hypothetical protein